MKRVTALFSALAAVVCLTCASVGQAGQFGCRCSQGPVRSAPVVYADPAAEADIELDACCAVPSCCGFGGVGGGLAYVGSLYGPAGGCGGCHGNPDPRSFESGFENLPNMDGGGVHHRLPFHSYRRPWAHPGVAEKNINIVW